MRIETEINGIALSLETGRGLFSPSGLDRGTRAMLCAASLQPGDKLLDLGCGYGPVGIYAAKLLGEGAVTLCDNDPQAVEQARENAARNGVGGVRALLSDGLSDVEERDFTWILSNPPYHADFSVPKRFIEQGFRHLAIGGRMLLVVKRRDWYQNKLISVFGGVLVRELDGYFLLQAERRTQAFAGAKPHRHKK